jgi:adenosylmethionine---8-amino-7-oxononanoate aminotransferase
VRLRLADGRELIDGMASWWCAIHGYRHPALDAAVREQVDRMAHVMFGGLTHEPAIRLAEQLIALTPDGLERVFFADSGSVSVEVAIKLALQYQRAVGRPQRTRLLALRGGYHGDTLGAMSLCDPIGGMHSLFTGVLPEHVFADRPPGGFDRGLDERWATHVRELIAAHAHELAGVIAEPVVQGAGGMWVYAPECVALLRECCDEHGLLLMLDEIATGFGRTGGELFACAHAGVVPDVMCVGKALTGGYMTLAATICTAAVAEAVSGGEGGGLMHGPTFMANPLACSVALASLDLLGVDGRAAVGGGGGDDVDVGDVGAGDSRGGSWRENVARIERGLSAGLEPARELAGVIDVRVQGAIGVVQLDRDVNIPAATAAAVEHGVWLRPFRDLIYAMPPYVIEEDELGCVTEAMVLATRAVLSHVEPPSPGQLISSCRKV